MTDQLTQLTRAARLPTGAFSVSMVAERWGTSDTFVYDLVKAGKLASFKLGNKLIRVRPEAVVEYENRMADAAPEPVPAPAPNAAAIARLIRAA